MHAKKLPRATKSSPTMEAMSKSTKGTAKSRIARRLATGRKPARNKGRRIAIRYTLESCINHQKSDDFKRTYLQFITLSIQRV